MFEYRIKSFKPFLHIKEWDYKRIIKSKYEAVTLLLTVYLLDK